MYIVKYSGPFGFIKPWTAVRDSKTFSQQFLTPSIIEGLRQKLEVSLIFRHKLKYQSISVQQEQVQSRGWEHKKVQKRMVRGQSILERGVMINPTLLLAFQTEDDAEKAFSQHICLCRNEDILLPSPVIEEISEEEFSNLDGFELRFEETEASFLVGFNRFNENKPMYGWIEYSGNSILSL